jgi:molecular chaperone GrpE
MMTETSEQKSNDATEESADIETNAVSDEAKKISELEILLKEKDSKYLYLYAEFETYKKRAHKEKEDLMKFGFEKAARDLVLVLDNLERAVSHTPPGTDPAIVEGLNMVIKQFQNTFQKQGVLTIETVGKDFDPNLHEAVGQIPHAQPEGKIAQEQLKGYTLQGRLLRPAMVLVSMGNLN